MDSLPLEVLRIICTFLDFRDAANVRFLTRNLSAVAAEFLVARVRFHTSKASLNRLEQLSNHTVFSRTVKVLVYEAALLADVKCRHEYAKHFEMDHHGLERPREPPVNCSDREHRLYLRNKSKWTKGIYNKYDTYRSLFESQKLLLDNKVVDEVLSRCIPKFPKLTFIDVDPIRRCAHMTSRRFIEEFGSDCASPLSGNFSRMSSLINCLLLPNNRVITSLRKLEINHLSPRFFEETRSDLLQQAFGHLIDLDIVLKLADGDVSTGEHVKESFRRHLSNNVLKDALASARKLEFLSIGVELPLPFYIDIADVFSTSTWTNLKRLGLSSFTSKQDNLLDMLKRQPNLKSVTITAMQLTHGNWPDALREMRTKLRLQSFLPIGYLEDPRDSWPMDLLNVPIYIDSFEEFDLSNAIDMYVTDHDLDFFDEDENDMLNPLGAGYGDFEEAEMVREMYGTLSELDETMSLASLLDIDDSEISDSDVSMPDMNP